MADQQHGGKNMLEHGESYRPAPRLKRGWLLFTGDGWAQIRAVRVVRKQVLITVEDGRTFRAGYLDAVLCRAAPPG